MFFKIITIIRIISLIFRMFTNKISNKNEFIFNFFFTLICFYINISFQKRTKTNINIGIQHYIFTIVDIYISNNYKKFSNYDINFSYLGYNTAFLSLFILITAYYTLQITNYHYDSFGYQTTSIRVLKTYYTYSIVRHPMYLSLLIYSFTIFLLSQNLIFGFSSFMCSFVFVFDYKNEEIQLSHEFGDEYMQYKEFTKNSAIIPFLW
jgi:protein-S-isoprenylcysteine O-methyltransferase Ste14